MKKLTVIITAVVIVSTAVYAARNYRAAGGSTWIIGGLLGVLSGGEIDVASGGLVDINEGATFTVDSGATVSMGAGFTIPDGATVTVQSGGSLVADSGATVKMTDGATMILDCIVNDSLAFYGNVADGTNKFFDTRIDAGMRAFLSPCDSLSKICWSVVEDTLLVNAEMLPTVDSVSVGFFFKNATRIYRE